MFPLQVSVRVMVQETRKEVEVQVRESTPVINIVFKVAEASGIKLRVTYTLIEVAPALKIGTVKYDPHSTQ